MKQNFKEHFASERIIAGLYREVPFLTRMFNKQLMYASLACDVHRNCYYYFLNKYQTKRERGEFRHFVRNMKKKGYIS